MRKKKDPKYVTVDQVIKAVDRHTKSTSEIVLDDDISVILEEIPAARVRKNDTGRWYHTGNYMKPYTCSACGSEQKFTTRYCPDCGNFKAI